MLNVNIVGLPRSYTTNRWENSPAMCSQMPRRAMDDPWSACSRPTTHSMVHPLDWTLTMLSTPFSLLPVSLPSCLPAKLVLLVQTMCYDPITLILWFDQLYFINFEPKYELVWGSLWPTPFNAVCNLQETSARMSACLIYSDILIVYRRRCVCALRVCSNNVEPFFLAFQTAIKQQHTKNVHVSFWVDKMLRSAKTQMYETFGISVVDIL